jgi:hypothetical protein
VRLLLAAIVAYFLIALPAAAAVINVTATDIGTTYIEWTWDSGYNLEHILIDGTEICGYETTNNSIIRSNLAPDSLHTINVSTNTDAGDASARTLPGSPGSSGITDYSSDATAAAYGVVGGLLTSVLVVKRWKKDI